MANRLVQTIYDIKDKAKAKLRQLKEEYRSNARAAEKAGDKIDTSFRKSGGGIASLTGRLGSLRLGFVGVIAAMVGAVKGIGQAIEAAQRQEKAEAKLETVLRNVVGAREDEIQALKDQAAALQKVTTFGDEEIINAQALLGTFNLSTDAILQLTPRLLDMAEANKKLGQEGGNLEAVTLAVGKAFTSGIGSLSRYGVALSDAQKAAFAAGDDVEKLNVVVEALDGNFKGVSEAIGKTFEGKVAQAKNAMGDLLERIGTFLTQNEGLKRLIEGVGESFETMTNSIKSDDGQSSRVLSGIADSLRVVGNVGKIAFNVVTILFSGALKLGADVATGILSVFKPVIALFNEELANSIQNSIKKLNEFKNNRITAIVDDVEDIAEGFVDASAAATDLIEDIAPIPDVLEEAAEEAGGLSEAQKKAAEEARAVRKAIEDLGLEYKELTEGVSENEAKTIGLFETIATKGDETGEVLRAAFLKAFESIENPKALEQFRVLIERLHEEGKLSSEIFEEFKNTLDSVEESAAKLADTLSKELAAATSAHSVAALVSELDKLVRSGELTAEQAQQLREEAIAMYGEFAEASRQATRLALGLDDVEESADDAAGALDDVDTPDIDVDIINNAVSATNSLGDAAQYVSIEFVEAARKVDAFLDQLSAGERDLQSAAQEASQLVTEFHFLDQVRLDRLSEVIRKAEEETKAFRDSIIESARRAEEELEKLQLSSEEFDRRRTERRIDELKARLNDVRLFYDQEAKAAVQAEIDALTKIQEIRDEQRQEESDKRQQQREIEASRDLAIVDGDFADASRQFTREGDKVVNINGDLYFLARDPSSRRELAHLLSQDLEEIYRNGQ